jgi:hypothetical protein
VVFDDLDQDGLLTAWEDRPFFCVRDRGWRCEIATSRIVIRTLEDHDDATYPIEVLWLASPEISPPEVCHQGECQTLTLHPRGVHSYAQLCESMRDATLQVRAADGELTVIPLSIPRAPLTSGGIQAAPDRLSARFSAPVMRARAWSRFQETEIERELQVDLAAGGRMMTAMRDVACEPPACSTWVHVAHLAEQQRRNDILVDRVDEVVHEISR